MLSRFLLDPLVILYSHHYTAHKNDSYPHPGKLHATLQFNLEQQIVWGCEQEGFFNFFFYSQIKEAVYMLIWASDANFILVN